MKKIYVIILLIVVVLGALGFYLYKPLASDEIKIVWDEKLLQGRKQYLALPVTHVTAQPQHPNIIVLVADDLGKMDISLYGGTNVATPHIDSIGHQGVIFTDSYITSPICSPSRAGLLTGRYQQRFGHEWQPVDRYPKNQLEYLAFKHFVNSGAWKLDSLKPYMTAEEGKQQGLPLSEITLAELLKKNGYQTGIIGKWHLGYHDSFRPLERGFGYHYGFYQAFSLYADSTDQNIVKHHHADFTDQYIWNGGRTGPSLIRRNDSILDEKEYLTTKFALEANQFIEKNRDKPFFLYVPFNAPHTPFQAPESYVDQFADVQDPNKRVYYAMIKALDDAVGSITKKIKDLELEENTLIFFISDNGGATYTHATDNAPLKGGKFAHYEGGINVPFVLKWTGKIPAGTIYKHPVSSLDIFTTAAAVSQSPLPQDREYDGVNLLPVVQTSQIAHEVLFWRSGSAKAVRKGDWKLVVSNRNQVVRLYDLSKDKSEKNNLATDQPEKVLELQQALKNWEKKLIKPLWPNLMYYEFAFEDGTYQFDL